MLGCTTTRSRERWLIYSEVRSPEEEPIAYCQRLAIKKGCVSNRSGHWVLAADTIVVDGSDIFEKPSRRSRMLLIYSNISRRLDGTMLSLLGRFAMSH